MHPVEAYRQDRGLVLLQRWAAEDWRPPPPFTLVELLRLNGFVAEWRLVAVEEGQQGLVPGTGRPADPRGFLFRRQPAVAEEPQV